MAPAVAPTGAALAAVRERYTGWLQLDQDQVLADRDEDPARIRALQIVLRMERDRPPSWPAALALAARGCAALCLDPRSEPGGEWFDAVRDYCAGHIRKITRRARAGHWTAVTDLPGIGLADGDTEIRVLVPGLVADLDRRVARLQVGGTDAPRGVPGAAVPGPVAALRVWLNPTVPMTLGKAMAQAGHAGMIAAALLAGSRPAALVSWREAGLAAVAETVTPGRWTELALEVADLRRAWDDAGLLAVRDAGFTEIDPGTVTVIARVPRPR